MQPAETNPCKLYKTALCPDLIMSPPDGLYVGRSPAGRLRLYATNHIINVGKGPLEIKGKRTGAREMQARQVIHRAGKPPIVTPDAGELYFKFVDIRPRLVLEVLPCRALRAVDAQGRGRGGEMIRTGPKLDYCFRDLDRVRGYARRTAFYPGCSQVRGLASDRLGVSPGWADVYPSTYPENWIDITGLKGCFSFVHRADPLGKIDEEREDNNIGFRHIRLPPRGGSVAPRGCPGPRRASCQSSSFGLTTSLTLSAASPTASLTEPAAGRPSLALQRVVTGNAPAASFTRPLASSFVPSLMTFLQCWSGLRRRITRALAVECAVPYHRAMDDQQIQAEIEALEGSPAGAASARGRAGRTARSGRAVARRARADPGRTRSPVGPPAPAAGAA